ncbi:hypothetical protein SIM22_04040 [Bacillus cereus group sp. BfR-BA-01363]|uniref:hypothetical protein n=1 Tax=Bacillus cereus group sp. BfR-BA-01363 TaxID=3094882 RepID=UPI0029C282CB|nr:hypothetical protein [Bacillus cereus group sp. BfR-BA-01363]MDX5853298.1 hypothetical protein [Bacillus cereus group sp. BfR-BA-01363]
MSLKRKSESLNDLKSVIMFFIKDVKTDLFITTNDKKLYRVNTYEWKSEGLLCEVGDIESGKTILVEYPNIKRIEDKIEGRVYYEVNK